MINIKYIFNLAYQSQVVAYHFDFYIDSKITPNIFNNNCTSFDVSWFLNYNAIYNWCPQCVDVFWRPPQNVDYKMVRFLVIYLNMGIAKPLYFLLKSFESYRVRTRRKNQLFLYISNNLLKNIRNVLKTHCSISSNMCYK